MEPARGIRLRWVEGVALVAGEGYAADLAVDRVCTTSLRYRRRVTSERGVCVEGAHTVVHVDHSGRPIPARPAQDRAVHLAMTAPLHPYPSGMDAVALPPTGTCEVSTLGRRSGRPRRTELWYVVVDGQVVLTGTPGARHWLANLREHPQAVLHLREPACDLEVVAQEVTDEAARRRIVGQAWRVQPWYAAQPFSIDDWVSGSPMVTLTPTLSAAAR